MTVKHKCSGKTWGAYRDVSGRVYECNRPATVQRDGKWYCWQHDPIRMEDDKKKRWAADRAKMDSREAMWARHARNAKLAALMTPELPALLEYLAEGIDCLAPTEPGVPTPTKTDDARALAARIREVLNEHQAT